MKIRVLHNFANYEAGQVFDDWPGGMCDIFIRKGLIAAVDEHEERAVETADEDRDVERADAAPKHKRKR